MQFLVIAEDAKDSQALERRLAARTEHLEGAKKSKADGKLHTAAALVDAQGTMKGSVLLVDFPDRPSLDAWLQADAYAKHKVWGNIEVREVKIAPL